MSTKGFAVFAAGLCLLAENNAANGHAGDRIFPVYQITEDMLEAIDGAIIRRCGNRQTAILPFLCN